MANPSTLSRPTRWQIVFLAVVTIATVIGAFQLGRKTVDAANVAKSSPPLTPPPTDPISQKKTLLERDHSPITVREIATVPFSELYDVLKSAPREQLVAWARDLDHMPRGPRQRAAITAYYKSLVQVDHHAAIEAVLHSENLLMREIALDALTKAAPESIWPDLAEMMAVLPYPRRGNVREDIIWDWSMVDPAAAAQFITTHPVPGEDGRLFSLLCNWGESNPEQARDWIEADPSRQTEDALRAFVTSWAETDRSAAVNYVLANASRRNFARAIDELAYNFVREAETDATNLVLRLPPDHAKGVVQYVAHMTTALILGLPDGYIKPTDAVAKWMVTLPVQLWDDSIGQVAEEWLKHDVPAATQWFNQLSPDTRDAALASFCRAATSESRDQVLTLGPTIGDQKLRDTAMGQFARNLGETKKEALEAINDLDVLDSEKAYLRKVMAEEKSDR